MRNTEAISALSALAQATRLETFRLLVSREPEGVPAGELARLMDVPQNTMSAHLTILAHAGLVVGERQSRSIIYRADLTRLREVTLFLLKDCCGGRPDICTPLIADLTPCCPEKSILTKLGAGRFKAYSAGSYPKGVVNPYALKVLARDELPVEGLRSKSWDEFAGADAPKMDFVFTVCDDAAGEVCPYWPGQPMTAHWGIEDPAAVEGTEVEKIAAFNQALRFMRNRISAFINLPFKSLSAMTLQANLKDIGQMDGATTPKDPHVIEYLKSPPTHAMLTQLIQRMDIPVRDLLRKSGTPYAELKLDTPSLTDDQLIDAMMEHPILINRPIVVSPKGVKLCRPSEIVLDLLPPQLGEFRKEDGELVIDSAGRHVATA
eukprot:gene15321-15466_t